MNRLDRALGISTLLAKALLGFEATAFGGFGLFLEALITVQATLPSSGLPLGSPWWTQRRWR